MIKISTADRSVVVPLFGSDCLLEESDRKIFSESFIFLASEYLSKNRRDLKTEVTDLRCRVLKDMSNHLDYEALYFGKYRGLSILLGQWIERLLTFFFQLETYYQFAIKELGEDSFIILPDNSGYKFDSLSQISELSTNEAALSYVSSLYFKNREIDVQIEGIAETIEIPSLSKKSLVLSRLKLAAVDVGNLLSDLMAILRGKRLPVAAISFDMCLTDWFSMIYRGILVRHRPELPPFHKNADCLNGDVFKNFRFHARNNYERAAVASLLGAIPQLVSAVIMFNSGQRGSKFMFNRDIVTNYGLIDCREAFAFAAVNTIDAGNRVLECQHGGGFGSWENIPEENFEIEFSDGYGVWGWADGSNPKVSNVFSFKLRACRKMRDLRKKLIDRKLLEGILLVGGAWAPLVTRFQDGPIGTELVEYYKEQQKLAIDLTHFSSSSVYFRPYPESFGVREYSWFESERRVDIDRGKFLDVLVKRRLVIFDHPTTGYIESMLAGIPTLVIAKKAWFPVRSEFRDLWARLSSVGVVHFDVESALSMALSVESDPEGWFNSEAVSREVLSFLSLFGGVNDKKESFETFLKR